MNATDDRLLGAARRLAAEIAEHVDLDASLQLWDGSRVPLGRNVRSALALTLSSPGVISSLLRRPFLDRLIRHYAHGQIGLEGGTLIDLGAQLAFRRTRRRLRSISKRRLAGALLPFLLAPAARPERSRNYGGDEIGAHRRGGDNRDFIRFHYDVGNDFYALFLDPHMQYSCAYFTDWGNDLEQAQRDKLEMICRKLRLQPEERLLDIGCGWGGLLCYAAQHYGVRAHGVTLSAEQCDYARARIAALGLEDRVTVALSDYGAVTGRYDKIASIGMAEHVGVANIPHYLRTVRGLLGDGGLFLNHAISRRAKRRKVRFARRAEQRALVRYIFPGGELDDLGHTIAALETAGFEVHDVEGWREHYALTTRLWCERLTGNRDRAIACVGPETYRLWVAYLAGVSLAFTRGTARIYQTLVSKGGRGAAPVPPSRADLYR